MKRGRYRTAGHSLPRTRQDIGPRRCSLPDESAAPATLLRVRAPVRQEPLVELRVFVCLAPGIVADTGVDGELHVSAGGLEGFDHFLRCIDGHHGVRIAVENPRRQVSDSLGQLRIPAAADRSDGREAIGISARQAQVPKPPMLSPVT